MENIKKQIISYLTKASKHTFIKPKSKWSNKNGVIGVECDYDDFTYFKLFIDGENFTFLEDGKIRKIDIDYYMNYTLAKD